MAAMAWIGGAIFMFILGVSLRDKTKQDQVYPNIGPIFGYFEVASLIILLSSGLLMANDKGLIDMFLAGDRSSEIGEIFYNKMMIVAFVMFFTILHFVIAFKTNGKKRTRVQNMLSRGSSLMILFLNFVALHYAIMLRNIL